MEKCYYCKNCEFIINKQKHQIDKNVCRQDIDFSTRQIYANKKIRDIWMNMLNTNYNTTEDMIIKLQQLKGKTKLKKYENINNYYNEMKNKNFQTQGDPFSKNVRSISKTFHEVLLLMKTLQTKPQVKKWIMLNMICNLLLLELEMEMGISINNMKMMKMIILMISFLITISGLILVKQYWDEIVENINFSYSNTNN